MLLCASTKRKLILIEAGRILVCMGTLASGLALECDYVHFPTTWKRNGMLGGGEVDSGSTYFVFHLGFSLLFINIC